MGLTIHWRLKARCSGERAHRLVNSLHQTALDLPFAKVGDVFDLKDEDCTWERRDECDPVRWALIQATEILELRRRKTGPSSYSLVERQVAPVRIISFVTDPGDGCEAANFGLCQYPTTIQTAECGTVRTRLGGWRWSSFCKTQYASNPACGGVSNFLRCHLAVIALLDRAKELGFLASVSDESEFWERRDLDALVKEVGQWNEQLAALTGRLKDAAGPGIQTQIEKFSNFERLEAAGQAGLHPGMANLTKLVARVLQIKPSRDA